MREEIERFVASLAIPDDRKVIVLAELLDHIASAAEAGTDPKAALGNLETLRRSLEAVETGFAVSRWHALARGAIAGTVIAVMLDQGGALMQGIAGALCAVAVAAVCAPPRALDLLRAELRGPRVRGTFAGRGLRIGPAITYLYTVMSLPFLIWIAMIAVRRPVDVDVPLSAFAVMACAYAVLIVEGIAARRRVA